MGPRVLHSDWKFDLPEHGRPSHFCLRKFGLDLDAEVAAPDRYPDLDPNLILGL